ncbi:MAG: hypothetical protein COA40_04040 [Aequorivita sp.]|nr:MAG: hypothetical protein COA40_04040 [Aequorivita sp.]
MSALNIVSQNTTLEGKLIVANPQDIEIVKNELEVYLTSCGPDKMIDVGDDLTFKFENLQPGEYELLFFPNGDTDYLNRKIYIDSGKRIVNFETYYFYNCRYNISENNKTCPKCKKENRVIPVKYGLIISSGNPTDYWPGGCIVFDCQPHWYCKRDKIEF